MRPRWGLVIQGPLTSYGSGPNAHSEGFDCWPTIERNFSNLIHFERVVVSTWRGEDFDRLAHLASRWPDNVSLIAGTPPRWDPDNRRKQWLSTLHGVQVLAEARVSHVLKIRTDQFIPRSLIDWITGEATTRSLSAGKLLASEFLPFELFYAGDFFMAGTLENMKTFSLRAGNGINVHHPNVVQDSVMRYLKGVDRNFREIFPSIVPEALSLIALHPLTFESYWHSARSRFFIFPRRQDFIGVEWRGQPLGLAIPAGAFGFKEEFDELSSFRHSDSARTRKSHLLALRAAWARHLKRAYKALVAGN